MNEFIAKHAEGIAGVLSGFDRLVFRGTLRPISYPEGMMGYLSGSNVRLTGFGRQVLQVSERLKQACKAGSAQEFDGACILSRFLKNDKFCFCDRHALRLEQ
jgi:hypothetical protein